MHTGGVNPKLPKEAAADFPNKKEMQVLLQSI